MSEMVVSTPVPEVQVGAPVAIPSAPAPTHGVSGDWKDMATDMARLEQELHGNTPAQPAEGQPPAAATVPQVPQVPAIPQATAQNPAPPAPQAESAAPAAPETKPTLAIPDKFKNAQGGLDQEKIVKSYAEAEKRLHQLQNGQAKPIGTAPAPATAPNAAQAPAPNAPLTPFEYQVASDLFAGGGYTEQQAISQARVLVRMEEARHRALQESTLREVSLVREAQRETAMRSELEAVKSFYPEVLTPEGYAALVQAREENPWLNSADTPWRAAATYVLGQRALGGRSTGQVMPNPVGAQQPVPPVPATPVPPIAQPLRLDTREQIEAHLATLTPQQEEEFWAKQGFKGRPVRSYNAVIGTMAPPR